MDYSAQRPWRGAALPHANMALGIGNCALRERKGPNRRLPGITHRFKLTAGIIRGSRPLARNQMVITPMQTGRDRIYSFKSGSPPGPLPPVNSGRRQV